MASIAALRTRSCLTSISLSFRPVASLPVLFVADLFHPADVLDIKRLLDGNMGHRRGRRRAMPMLESWRKPHGVARPHLFNRSALALYPSQSRGDDQALAQRMRVPRGPGTGLKCDLTSADPRRI